MSFYDGASSMRDWLAHERFMFGIRQSITDPRAHATVKNVREPLPMRYPLVGIRVIESDAIRDHAYVIDGLTVVLPKYNRYGERVGISMLKPRHPLDTRLTLGHREAARAKRREWKGLRV